MPRRHKTPFWRTPWFWGVAIALKLISAAVLYWVFAPMNLRTPVVDLSIDPGTSVRGVADVAVASGIDTSATALWLLMRVSGQSRQLRAGSYEITTGTSPWALLRKLVRGDQSLRSVTVVEGWTWAQMRRLIDQAEHLRHDTLGMSDEALMARLGRSGVPAEGRFFPDTYTYGKGTSDLRVYERALKAMDRQLERAPRCQYADKKHSSRCARRHRHPGHPTRPGKSRVR